MGRGEGPRPVGEGGIVRLELLRTSAMLPIRLPLSRYTLLR